ncbi:MAG: methyltransferase family protein [Gemmatimonadota bacterium]
MSGDDGQEDGPDVAFHPPFLVIALLVAGWTLHRAQPIPFLPLALARPVGGLLAVVSFGLFSWAALTMLRAGTNLPTHLPAKALVRTGPYRFSRNPIYLALAIGFAALAAWLNTAWYLLVDVLFVGLTGAGVIVREERYLSRKFGAAYERYRTEVRRWL